MRAVVMEATSAVGISVAGILAADISEALAADTSVDVTSVASVAGTLEDGISGAAILAAGTSAVDTSEAAILAIEALAIISADRISRADIVASETAASRIGIFVATGILRATAARLQKPAV